MPMFEPIARVSALLSESGLLRPPGVRSDEGRSASWLELFFDLAFVLVVAEIAGALAKDLSWHGFLTFAGLFTVIWWSWASSTLYANRFDTDDLVYRLFKLAGMLAVIGMAAAAAEATSKYAVHFAAAYVVLRVLLFAEYARAHRALPEARPIVRRYMLGAAAGAFLWSVSMFVPPPVRYVLWTVGVLVDVIMPFAATFAPGSVPLHLEHLPVRLALFLILVLGESVAAIAHGVHDETWRTEAIVVGVVSFVLAAGLWWVCLDLAGTAAKKLLLEHGGAGRVATDIWFYGHLPLALGLAAIGVGIEQLILETAKPDTTGETRTLLCGGVALVLAAVSATNSAMSRNWSGGWWWPMLAAAVAAADGLLDLPAVPVVSALAVLIAVVIVTGTIEQLRGRVEVVPL